MSVDTPTMPPIEVLPEQPRELDYGLLLPVAGRCLSQCGMDRKKAAWLFEQEIIASPELTVAAVRFTSRQLLKDAATKTHMRDLRAGSAKLAERLREEMGGVLRSWSLRGGGVLADARRPEIDQEIKWYVAQGRGNLIRAQLLRKIRERMPDDQVTVEEVVEEGEMNGLMERATKEVDALLTRGK